MNPQDYERLYEKLSIKDDNDEHSLVNLCPSYVAERIKAIPDELFEKPPRKQQDYVDEMLRLSFWEEYRRAVRVGTKMQMTNVYMGIITKRAFDQMVLNTFRLHHMVTPPREVQLGLEALVHLGLERMRDILEAPIVDPKGRTDARLAAVQLKVFEDVMNRRRGHVLQKIETTSRNLNVSVDATPKEAQRVTLEDIERKIAELEAASHKPPALIEARDVGHEEV